MSGSQTVLLHDPRPVYDFQQLGSHEGEKTNKFSPAKSLAYLLRLSQQHGNRSENYQRALPVQRALLHQLFFDPKENPLFRNRQSEGPYPETHYKHERVLRDRLLRILLLHLRYQNAQIHST